MTVTVIGDNTGDDYSGTEDSQIREFFNTTNYGSSATQATTKWSSGDHTHLNLSFSGLSNIAASEVVSAATVYMEVNSSTGTYALAFRRLLRDWVEAEVTWDIWKTSNNWTSGGALSDGNDRSASKGVTASLDNTTGYRALTATQIKDDTKDFVDGTATNYGWHVERDDSGDDSTTKTWLSSNFNDGRRPYISVTHAAAAGSRPQGPLGHPFYGPFGGPI